MRGLLHEHGLRVPALLAQDLDAGFLLLEDLGGPTLAKILDERNADEWFGRSIEQLLRLQAIPVPADFGQFGEALLQRDAGLPAAGAPPVDGQRARPGPADDPP
ncbi:hypothetical protein G6F24_017908 [Rhizopus arrhizus]|nr:hypothetical protein G6F24_017908 [Rhizopus arrhizus]